MLVYNTVVLNNQTLEPKLHLTIPVMSGEVRAYYCKEEPQINFKLVGGCPYEYRSTRLCTLNLNIVLFAI